MIMGRLPLSLFYALLPLPFLAVEYLDQPQAPIHRGYLGLSLVICAIIGLITPFVLRSKKSPSRTLPAIVCLLISCAIVFGYRLPPIAQLQFIQVMNAARYLLYLSFFLSLTAGIGAHLLLASHPGRTYGNRIFTLLLVLIFLDLGSTTFQHLYTHKEHPHAKLDSALFSAIREKAAPHRERDEYPPYRIAWLAQDLSTYLSVAQQLYLSATPTPDAFHPSELRSLETLTRPFIEFARLFIAKLESPHDFGKLSHAPVLQSGFMLLNVRHVLLGHHSQQLPHWLHMRYDSPIVVSGKRSPFPQEVFDSAQNDGSLDRAVQTLFLDSAPPPRGRQWYKVYWLLQNMGIRLDQASAEQIFTLEQNPEQDLGTQPTVAVLSHRVTGSSVDLRVAISEACFARLSYAYYPYLTLRVDGQAVTPFETYDRFLGLALDPGEHHIELRASLSPLRQLLIDTSIALFLLGVSLSLREIRGRRLR